MEKSLVSVIVPIYNADKFLERCLDSIINQSYKRLEIILVDDGSEDKSVTICDSYAKNDTRIKVIHKKNEGVASARNTGLDNCTGDYIIFVDSDDYVTPDMIEYMLEGAETFNTNIVSCGYYLTTTKKISAKKRTLNTIEYTNFEAVEEILKLKTLTNYSWDKLFAKQIWENLRFPHGRNYEDVLTIYQAVEKTNKLILLPDCKYYYFQNKASITHRKKCINLIENLNARIERFYLVCDKYPACQTELLKNIFFYINQLLKNILKINYFDFKKIKNDRTIIIDFLKKYINEYFDETISGKNSYKELEYLSKQSYFSWKFCSYLHLIRRIKNKIIRIFV